MNEQLQRDIQAYLVAHPNATVLDVCAEFELTDAETIRALHALRGQHCDVRSDSVSRTRGSNTCTSVPTTTLIERKRGAFAQDRGDQR